MGKHAISTQKGLQKRCLFSFTDEIKSLDTQPLYYHHQITTISLSTVEHAAPVSAVHSPWLYYQITRRTEASWSIIKLWFEVWRTTAGCFSLTQPYSKATICPMLCYTKEVQQRHWILFFLFLNKSKMFKLNNAIQAIYWKIFPLPTLYVKEYLCIHRTG